MQVKENSFRQIDGFVMLDKNEHYDINDKPMALIKISTENITAEERKRIIFKGNLETEFDVSFEPTEIHLYLSAQAANFIEIHHPDYGKTEFTLPYDLKGFCGYEMVLQYVPIGASSAITQQNNYLTIICDQPNASVYIDDQYVSDGFKSFAIGTTHSWRIECDLYHTENGIVTITKGETINIEKKLRPAYGFVNVTSKPENGAVVFINNKKVGTTPYKSDKLASGTYNVRVVKDMYRTAEQTFVITDGNTTEAVVYMTPNFVNMTLETETNSDIYIDGQYKAKGKWNGRVSDGAHFVEVKKDGHRTVSKNLNLVLGKDEYIKMEAPTAITGMLDISSVPMNANIYLNDKHYGTTPKIISDLIIGDYTLKLEKEGYTSVTKNITIEENETFIIKEQLPAGNEAVIKTDKTDKTDDKASVDENHKSASKKKPLNKYFGEGINFITINGAYSFAPQTSYGITFGHVKKVGWFISAMSNFDFTGFNMVDKSYEEVVLTGNSRSTRLSVMGGFIAKIGGPVYLKFGAGYGMRIRSVETADKEYVEYPNNTYEGVDLSAGLQFNLKNVTFDFDVVTTDFKMTEFKLGIGFNWN